MLEKSVLKKIYEKDKFKRYFNLVLGCFLSAVGFNLFCVPNDIVLGGVSGFAIIVNEVTPINTSIFIFIVDIFLLILSYFLLGKEKTKYSVMGSILFPLFVSLTANINNYLNLDTSVLLLAALLGGIIEGFGSGFVFKAGFSAGGADIINQIFAKYMKTSMGTAMYITNGIIILLSGFVFGINKIIYALILLYIEGYIADRVILGISDSKAFYIITKEDKKIKDYIIKELNHSVTELSAQGGFARQKETVLMCVLPTKEYYKLKEGINSIDKDAFFVVTDSYEVVGGA